MFGTDSELRKDLLTEAECTVHSSSEGGEVSEVTSVAPRMLEGILLRVPISIRRS